MHLNNKDIRALMVLKYSVGSRPQNVPDSWTALLSYPALPAACLPLLDLFNLESLNVSESGPYFSQIIPENPLGLSNRLFKKLVEGLLKSTGRASRALQYVPTSRSVL